MGLRDNISSLGCNIMCVGMYRLPSPIYYRQLLQLTAEHLSHASVTLSGSSDTIADLRRRLKYVTKTNHSATLPVGND